MMLMERRSNSKVGLGSPRVGLITLLGRRIWSMELERKLHRYSELIKSCLWVKTNLVQNRSRGLFSDRKSRNPSNRTFTNSSLLNLTTLAFVQKSDVRIPSRTD